MDDSYPRERASTGGFRRGQPRSAAAFGDIHDWRVLFLASGGPTDPVLALHMAASDGSSAVLADPSQLLADREDLSPAERSRRERLREGGAGITAFASDSEGRRTVFALSGQVWLVDGAEGPRRLATAEGAVDPRLSPDGAAVAYHAAGGLRVFDVATATDSALATPADATETWGLAEFIAAEEMGRYRGFWWAADSSRLLVAAVREAAVESWWISDPADPASPPRTIRYPRAGTPNAAVALWVVDLSGAQTEVRWDHARHPYLASVRCDEQGALISVQSRDQRDVVHLAVDLADGTTTLVGEESRAPWVELVPGSPRFATDGELLSVMVDPAGDARRLRKGDRWLTPPEWYVRSVLDSDESGVWIAGATDPRESHLVRVGFDGIVSRLTPEGGWHPVLAAGPVPVVAVAESGRWQPRITVGDPRQPAAVLPDRAASPSGTPRVRFLPHRGAVRVAVVLPDQPGPAPVIVSSYAGPHAQRVIRAPLTFATEHWLADNGFAVVVVDGRGTPGVSPSCEAAIAGDLAGPPLADQVAGLRAAAEATPGRLDLDRVGIRGWSFGGYLAALAVLKLPARFHAAFAGAPVTEWRLYDTHYTERYLGEPGLEAAAYEASSLLPLAPGLDRPLCLVHGLADDNVVAAHTLQLSAALTAAGRPHEVLPLPGISHMTPQESIAENLLRLELAFFQRHLTA